MGSHPNVILNAAVNPDFSQVEADVAQLEINRRFALFYPEKRPFFLEGADFFLTPLQAVFTRTVADPLWGAKLTGKAGRTAMGFFAAQDTLTNLVFPSNQVTMQGSLDEDVTGGVFRLRQDVGQASTLGVLYTGRVGSDYYNHVAGADGFFRLDDKNSISFQYLHSETDYPLPVAEGFGQEADRFGGNAFKLEYQHFSRKWIIDAAYDDKSPGFRADYGFVPRVDTRTGQVMVLRQFWGKPKGWYNLIRLGLAGEAVWDYEGTLTDRGITLGAMYQGNLETLVNVHANFVRTFYEGQYFDTPFADLAFRIRPFSGSEIGLRAQAGKTVDFANVRLADTLAVGPNFSLSLFRHMNLVPAYIYERLSREGSTIYTANLAQAKLVWNFNVRCFVRAIVQFQDLRQNPAEYAFPVDSHSQGLFTQFLFSYKLNPRTVLFLGYSDNAMGGVFDSWLGPGRVSLTRTDRTFFLKIGYALQI